MKILIGKKTFIDLKAINKAETNANKLSYYELIPTPQTGSPIGNFKQQPTEETSGHAILKSTTYLPQQQIQEAEMQSEHLYL